MPKPRKFLTDEEIEERAAEVLDKHIVGARKSPNLPIDIDTLTECDFRFRVSWEPIIDPPGCRTYATLIPEAEPGLYVARLIMNEKFRDFLGEHPEVERFTRGHELCHWVVHIDEGKLKSGTLPFGSPAPTIRFHRLHYSDKSMNAEKKNRLAQFAFQDERAYRALKKRESHPEGSIEPAWMHRQAEHFSACLLVPRGPLFEALERGGDPALYGTRVDLAARFQVSKTVMQIRLTKLGIIEEVGPGTFRNRKVTSYFDFSSRSTSN
jgi:IrrE N-terminal-like domain